LKGIDPKLIVFFASSSFAPEEIAERMETAFPGAETFGCSTAGEIVTGKMLTKSIVAMAFNKEAVKDAKVEVIDNLNKESNRAFNAFQRHFNKTMKEMDPKKYVGIILTDGLCGKEELIMDKIGDLTNVTFIGGSAGDDLKFENTYVYANGKSYSHGAVLAILEPATEFSFIKTQSFCQLPQKLVVTKANEFTREVLEFNNKPAAVAYAEALGTSVEEAKNRFMHNPIGLVFEGEPFVRSPQQITGESMHFYCSVKEGMELSLLESTDIIASTKQALDAARTELGGISGIINFNCILRTLELGQKGLTEDYGKLFEVAPTVGFSTYGEQYIGHINQTATMLVFR
ncbi:MAG TPA: FIST N-terminal domain-containing protein, partial [Geobacteraceae bacterium]|nr:FIST N-terminal domain-containing protein [Geobacteraceae bacterium]